jgi:hypothetical protein
LWGPEKFNFFGEKKLKIDMCENNPLRPNDYRNYYNDISKTKAFGDCVAISPKAALFAKYNLCCRRWFRLQYRKSYPKFSVCKPELKYSSHMARKPWVSKNPYSQ